MLFYSSAAFILFFISDIVCVLPHIALLENTDKVSTVCKVYKGTRACRIHSLHTNGENYCSGIELVRSLLCVCEPGTSLILVGFLHV